MKTWAQALAGALLAALLQPACSAAVEAAFGQSRKLIENWWLWIAADLIYIPLYGYKGLWLTAILYCAFLALCVAGLRAWRGALRTQVPA